MEMTDSGKPGKSNAGFPPFPKFLEIADAIPTFPPHDPDSPFYKSQKEKASVASTRHRDRVGKTYSCLPYPSTQIFNQEWCSSTIRSGKERVF